MLRSLLLICLFFGLVSMILPDQRRFEWISLLLIAVLMLSVISCFVGGSLRFDLPQEDLRYENDLVPEASVIQAVVSDQVVQITGEAPVSVECDLSRNGESYTLTRIRVVLRTGNEREVQNALQSAFRFDGFTVLRQDSYRSDESDAVSQEE